MKSMRAFTLIPLLLLSLAAAPTTQIVEFDREATKITAKLKDASARTLLEELARPTGEKFETMPRSLFDEPPLSEARFSAEFEAQPYWSAMLECCEQAKLSMSADSFNPANPGALRLSAAGNSAARPSFVDGPVLFVLGQVERSNQVLYGAKAPRGPDQIRISATMLLEPKLRQRCAIGAAKAIRAVDDAGNELAAIKLPGPPSRMGGMWQPMFISVALEYPAKPGKRLKEVNGEVELTVPKRMLKAVIAIDQANTTMDVGENVLHIRLERGGTMVNAISLQLVREEESDEAWKSTLLTFLSTMRVALETNKRTLIANPGGSTNFASDHADKRLSFFGGWQSDEKLQRVTVEWPLETQTMAAKFKFVDLPMP
jgi:hypothetical protein